MAAHIRQRSIVTTNVCLGLRVAVQHVYMLGINVGCTCLLEINGGCSYMIGVNGCRTRILGINSGSTCMLEIIMKAHVFWDQMWTHIYVGRSMEAENAHRVLTADTHSCLRSKVVTHVHVCIGDQQQKYIGN